MWRERQSNSRFVESVWESCAPVATSRTVIADPCSSLALVKNNDAMRVVLAGPKTKPHDIQVPAGSRYTTIRFKPGVSFKGVSLHELTDASLLFMADAKARFQFEGAYLQFPHFDKIEQFVDALYEQGYLEFKDPEDATRASPRTYSRYIQRVTGLSPHQLYQLQRMHEALRLLKQGVSAVDVAAELAFVDQSHLTRSSKRFLGHTPKHSSQLPQTP